jgi:hypothetical protein
LIPARVLVLDHSGCKVFFFLDFALQRPPNHLEF